MKECLFESICYVDIGAIALGTVTPRIDRGCENAKMINSSSIRTQPRLSHWCYYQES